MFDCKGHPPLCFFFFFFFNDTATTEIYTLSLHDALPIYRAAEQDAPVPAVRPRGDLSDRRLHRPHRSEEHTSELQSQSNLVCRLLLEKKKHRIRNSSCSGSAPHPPSLSLPCVLASPWRWI